MRKLICLLFLPAVLTLFLPAINYANSPNIVFILADDWGWTDWQMNGDPHGSTFYETPHLNQMAQEGMYFSQAYAHPLCSPSRVALMTGKYPGARIKMHQAITGGSVANPKLPAKCGTKNKTCFPENKNRLPIEEITIAEELKRAGYTTCHFGKWHLGNANFYPKKQGFDSQFAVGGAGPGRGGYFAPYDGLSDIPQGPKGEYLAERLTDEVCKKLEQLKDDKFFIYLAHYNVHAPYQGKDDLVAKYDAKAKNDPANRHKHPTMGAMVESLDSSIGQVMAKLDELGLTDSTIVIVMGDNGGIGWANDKNKLYKDIKITSNHPLKTGKCCFYEGGVRVPLLVKYPKMVASNSKENTPVHLIDMYPTLLELAGISADPKKDVLDGVSIVPLLEQSSELDVRPIFCHFPRKKQIGSPVGGSYVRMGDYKLYRLYGFNDDASDKYELFNIPQDPGETKDSSAVLSEITDSLKTMLKNWLEETDAYVPHINPDWSGYSNANAEVIQAGKSIDLAIIPNPSDGNFRLDIQLNEPKNIDITIADIAGKSLFSAPTKMFNSGKHEVPLNVSLNEGTYFVKVAEANLSNIEIKKIVIH
ncbi:MAG: sulfatase-like hydrolase/transferase [Bacteroidales bacterium]|nr:sulfatase-like hydrolase/transferase [Bacteroidales bacterium]